MCQVRGQIECKNMWGYYATVGITRSIVFPVIQSSVRYAFADILYLFDMDAENASHCEIVRNLIRDTEERRKVCLTRPSDAPLGLIVAEPKENQALLVLQRESDVIQTWNRQNPHLQIEVGQGIWEVNGISDDFGGVEPLFFLPFPLFRTHLHHSYPRRFGCFFHYLIISRPSGDARKDQEKTEVGVILLRCMRNFSMPKCFRSCWSWSWQRSESWCDGAMGQGPAPPKRCVKRGLVWLGAALCDMLLKVMVSKIWLNPLNWLSWLNWLNLSWLNLFLV